jgi:hypothetical protein
MKSMNKSLNFKKHLQKFVTKYYSPFKLLTFLILILSTIEGQNMVSSDILQNVFEIKYKDNTGSSFRISFNNKDYLITAKHLFGTIKHNSEIEFEVLKDSGWIKLKAIILEHTNNNIDIAVLALNTNQLKGNKVNLKGDYLLSQKCFFLGFPFGLNMNGGVLNDGFPLPFVKSGILSSFTTDSLGMTMIFLDGHNNPGFSGGPVVVIDQSKPTENVMSIISVISAYINEEKIIKTPFGDISNKENSGIVISYSIKHVFEILERK